MNVNARLLVAFVLAFQDRAAPPADPANLRLISGRTAVIAHLLLDPGGTPSLSAAQTKWKSLAAVPPEILSWSAGGRCDT
jgi:hypothetical protein